MCGLIQPPPALIGLRVFVEELNFQLFNFLLSWIGLSNDVHKDIFSVLVTLNHENTKLVRVCVNFDFVQRKSRQRPEADYANRIASKQRCSSKLTKIMKRKFVKRDNLFRTVILTLFPEKSRMTSKLSTGLKNQILSKFRPYIREKKIFLIPSKRINGSLRLRSISPQNYAN